MWVAFKKKRSTFLEWIVSIFTLSKYVHCELVTKKLNNRFFGYSSEPFAGVRSSWIFNLEEWDFVEIEDVKNLNEFYEKTKNAKYDYLGALGIVFGNKDNPKKYFCSEWISTLLNLKNPSKISPAKLYKILKEKYDK